MKKAPSIPLDVKAICCEALRDRLKNQYNEPGDEGDYLCRMARAWIEGCQSAPALLATADVNSAHREPDLDYETDDVMRTLREGLIDAYRDHLFERPELKGDWARRVERALAWLDSAHREPDVWDALQSRGWTITVGPRLVGEERIQWECRVLGEPLPGVGPTPAAAVRDVLKKVGAL